MSTRACSEEGVGGDPERRTFFCLLDMITEAGRVWREGGSEVLRGREQSKPRSGAEERSNELELCSGGG